MSELQIAILIPVGATVENRLALIAEWAEGNLPVSKSLPCGNGYAIADLLHIPAADVPCPCGDGRHWLVKYAG